MQRPDRSLPWNQALLAVVPGLLAALGLVSADFSATMAVGGLLLSAFLVAAYWGNGRQLPGWSLLAAGMLAAAALALAAGVLGGLAALLAGQGARQLVLLGLLAVLTGSLGHGTLGRRVPRLAWALLALVVVCQLAVRVKYFVLFGVSWEVAGQWLSISLYAAVMALLLPVALGLRLAPRYGRLALLFVVGMVFISLRLLLDVNHQVSDWLGESPALAAYQAFVPLLFTVAAPLWFARAPSARGRVAGLLALAALAVMVDLVMVGWSYRGALPLMIWISFIPYTTSVLLTLGVADLLYRERPEPAAG
jgi:hypothetical protein